MAESVPGMTTTAQATKDEFRQKACDIWATEICPALIFDRDLFMCTGCLALFPVMDTNSTHPAGHVVKVTDLCRQQAIATQDLFVAALWDEATKLLPQYGVILMPRVNPVHFNPPKQLQTGSANAKTQATRLQTLEKELATVKAENAALRSQNRGLQHELQSAVDKMVNESSLLYRIKYQAATYLDGLHRVLHPDGCGCIEPVPLPPKPLK